VYLTFHIETGHNISKHVLITLFVTLWFWPIKRALYASAIKNQHEPGQRKPKITSRRYSRRCPKSVLSESCCGWVDVLAMVWYTLCFIMFYLRWYTEPLHALPGRPGVESPDWNSFSFFPFPVVIRALSCFFAYLTLSYFCGKDG